MIIYTLACLKLTEQKYNIYLQQQKCDRFSLKSYKNHELNYIFKKKKPFTSNRIINACMVKKILLLHFRFY